MTKRKKRARGQAQGQVEPTKPSAPFNNPFGSLTDLRSELPVAEPTPSPAPKTEAKSAPQRSPLGSIDRLVVQREKKGRAGKTVTRITGLPRDQLDDLAKQMKSALGCGATREEEDLVLLGSLVERAQAWLEEQGAKRVVVSGAAPKKNKRESRPQKTSGGGGSGQRRTDLASGLEVDIVLKKDQRTGALTRGVIQDILTRSATHPHGIKVRLTDGSVGRVKHIIG